MRKYEKPVVELNNDMAEGVYAASGTAVANTPLCDSQYMDGVWHAPAYGWNTTVKDYYGCLGCPAYRYNGCALDVDQAYIDGAKSYDTDSGSRMPDWERQYGLSADVEINDANGLPY